MESTISNFYANELFIFDPTNKQFYAHEEFLYQFSNSQDHATLNLSNDYLALLNNTKAAQVNESENIIPESKEKTSYFDKEEEKDENENPKSGKDLNADLFEQNPDLQKHNFDIFLEIVDLTHYANKISFQDFFRLYYTWLGDQKYKLAAYAYFRRKGYEIESGCTFSFDYLLYKEGKNEIGLLNKTDRIHSEYGVYLVCEDLKQKITFKDLHRKHRIAHNYSKNLIVCNLKRKNAEDIMQEELSIDKVLDQFSIADMMYARSQLHIKTKNKK